MSRTDLLVLAGEHVESGCNSYYDDERACDEEGDEGDEGDESGAPLPASAPCARSFTSCAHHAAASLKRKKERGEGALGDLVSSIR